MNALTSLANKNTVKNNHINNNNNNNININNNNNNSNNNNKHKVLKNYLYGSDKKSI